MKRFNLLSILILFFTFFGVQCVVGKSTYKYGPEKPEKQSDGYYYCIYHSSEIKFEGDNVNYYFYYPTTGAFLFDAKCGSNADTNRKIKVGYGIPKEENKIYGYEENFDWKDISTTDKLSTSYTPEIDKSFNESSARVVTFNRPGGVFNRTIKNIKVRMAPHTKMNTTSVESFNTPLGIPDSRTISFLSCLTGSNGLTASIVESKSETATPTDLNEQVKLYHPGLGENSTLLVGANEFVAINTGDWDFQIKFTPTEIITEKTIYIRIKNNGAVDNPVIYIPVTLSSSLDNPANFKYTKSGYSYVKLQWDAVPEATSYNLYDKDKQGNDSLIQRGITATSFAIGNLKPGSTHNYTIKSYYNGSESAGAGINVTLKSFPVLSSVTIPEGNVTQNSLIVNWSKGVSTIDDQPITGYHIHLYQHDYDNQNTTYYKGYYILKGADITTYTLDKLIDNTTYTIYVGPEFYDPIAQTTIIPTAGSDWRSATTTTKSFLPETHNGVIEYRGVWYIVSWNDLKTLISGYHLYETTNTYEFNLDYPCNNLSYEAWLNKTANIIHSIYDDATKITKELQKDPDYLSENRYNPSNPIDTTITKITFTARQGGTGDKTIYLDNIWAKIAPHIKLNTTESYDFGEVELDQTPSLAVDFQSFLVSQQGKLVVESDNSAFKINGMSESKVLAEGNTFEQLNDNNYNFEISFVGNDLGSTSAKITIKDVISDKNGNDSVIVNKKTINVNGTRIKKTPTITWIDSKIIKVGESVENAASSNCGTEITYTSDSLSVIKVEGNKLIALSEGTANITAITKGNNIYKSDTSTVAFTTTNKKIQIIDWNQNFYLLTLRSSDMALTAKSLDRETNEETRNPIKYSSSNTSVVTVDNGVLHVVGIGQTSIIAHQEGTSEYAPTFMRKYVVVRNAVDGDCNSELALQNEGQQIGNENINAADPNAGGWDWNPLEIESELKTVGEYLSFVVDCSDASTEKFGDVNGARLIITDQDGNKIYDEKGNTQTPEPIKLSRSVRKLKFQLTANLIKSISQIAVTPAIYLDVNKEEIVFNTPTQVANTTTLDDIVTVDWANQPDVIWASITDIKYNGENIAESDIAQTPVFTITKNALIGGLCGNFGTTPLSVAFSPIKAGKYTANLIIGVGENTEAKHTIQISAEATAADQSLIWEDFELTTADKDITITDVLCQSTKYNLLNQLGETITYSSSNPNVVEINNNTLTVHKYGETVTITASQTGKEGYINPATATKTFTPSIGTIRFDTDGNWNTTSNWLPVSNLNKQRNVVPSAVVNAEIAADATISNTGTINQINDITFNGGSLAIADTSALKANKITNENADNLILKASADGNATLIYADGTPKATVEMYSKAENGTLDHTDGKNPQWQYVGVAVDGTTTSAFSNAWLLKWTEAESADNGDPWSEAPLDANIALVPWAGYSISQPVDTTYSTKGSLMRGDHTYTLTRTESTDPDCGFNLLTNSYTAPIDIAKLEPDSFKGADACIILYNTGTYAEWESHQANSGENPGQLTVIPVVTGEAAGLTTTIASMQAFFVKANENNATFTVKYNDAVAGASNHGNQMRAPEAQYEFNVLKITIEGENTRDYLFLLENEATSKAYDNGYEARKIFDAPRGHQMYATCQYGYASIDCSESFVGQTIGLKGDNEGEMLTISFDTDRLDDYQSLYLYDKVTGKYVNILSNEKYTFFGIKGANDNRFSIVTNPDDKAQTPPFVIIGNELAFDKSQINSDNANIYIYDTSGRLLMTDKINPYENYNIPDMPEGIYLVSMNGYTTKIVRK